MGLFDMLGPSYGSAPKYTPPPSIARAPAPAPVIHYDSPAVWSTPSPVYQAPPAYQAPQPYSGGLNMNYATDNTPAAPAAPPPPPPKPKIDYNSADYLSGKHDSELDGTFHDQATMYQDKLKRYIADYDSQAGTKAWGAQNDPKANLHDILGGSMGVDYDQATKGIQRNKDLGLQGVTEDFANRGMVNSGLYSRDFGISRDQYDKQGQNLDQGTRSQLQTLDFNRANQATDTTANIGAARRDALNRLASSQTL